MSGLLIKAATTVRATTQQCHCPLARVAQVGRGSESIVEVDLQSFTNYAGTLVISAPTYPYWSLLINGSRLASHLW